MSDLPKRRFTVEISIGGDTIADAAFLLQDFMDRILEGSIHSVTGGPSSGGHFLVTENPDMTHERYFAAIKAMKGAQQ